MPYRLTITIDLGLKGNHLVAVTPRPRRSTVELLVLVDLSTVTAYTFYLYRPIVNS